MRTRARLFLAACLLALPLPAARAQERCPEFRELAERAVPREVGGREWMERLLSPRAGPQAVRSFQPAAAQRAVDDELRPDAECRERGAAECVYRSADGESVLRVDRTKGSVTYLNRKRRFDAAARVANEIRKEQALRFAETALAAFGVPREELGPSDISVLMAAAQDTERRNKTKVLRAEVHVRFPRRIGGTPVVGSKAMAAIDSRGRIARLHLLWPDFGVLPGLAAKDALPRDRVVRDLFEAVARDNPCGSIAKLDAYVAYVRAEDVPVRDARDEREGRASAGSGFVPALVVSVLPPEVRESSGEISLAEQQLVLPLLGSAGD